MHPQPNESGIYTDITERLPYPLKFARGEVLLTHCADGWRWGYSYWSDARVSHSNPNVDRRAWRERQKAIEQASEFLRALADDEADRLSLEPEPVATHQMELF